MRNKTQSLEYYVNPRTKYKDHFVGIEVEIEQKAGTSADPTPLTGFWSMKGENSLRNGFELVSLPVLRGTKGYNATFLSLGNFFSLNKGLETSIRCSVHMHINVSHLTIRELYNVILNWYLFEDFVVSRNGPLRRSNLFCMKMSEARGIGHMISHRVRTRSNMTNFSANESKYSAMNLARLSDLGTLEFRFMRGTLDVVEIESWARLLVGFVSKAKAINPAETVSQMIQGVPVLSLLTKFFSVDDIGFLRNSDEVLGLSEIKAMCSNNIDTIRRISEDLNKPRRYRFPSEKEADIDMEEQHILHSTTTTGNPPPLMIYDDFDDFDDDFDDDLDDEHVNEE